MHYNIQYNKYKKKLNQEKELNNLIEAHKCYS